MIKHRILRVTSLPTSMSAVQISGEALCVFLEGFGENMQWKMKEALNFLAISNNCEILVKNLRYGASLVAQWLRIRLPMQGTRVRALVQEGPTGRGATKPVCHNY